MLPKQTIRYLMLAAIIISLFYAYFSQPERSEQDLTLTPREIIQTIEQRKAEARESEAQPAPPGR